MKTTCVLDNYVTKKTISVFIGKGKSEKRCEIHKKKIRVFFYFFDELYHVVFTLLLFSSSFQHDLVE